MDTEIANLLNADAELASYLPGRVWDRPLKRRGDFATPEAFASVAPHNILPASVVTNAPLTGDRDGAPGTYTGFVTVWLHGPEGPLAGEKLDNAARRVLTLLRDLLLAAPDGSGILLERAERFGLRDDPVIPGAQLDYVRFTLAGYWR
jgi:hypothetical protein